MEQITIDLDDDMTIGALRALAQSMGKRLAITLVEAKDGRRPVAATDKKKGRAREAAAPEPAKSNGGRRRRKLSPEARAALGRNLAKARAVRSANAKAARVKAGKA